LIRWRGGVRSEYRTCEQDQAEDGYDLLEHRNLSEKVGAKRRHGDYDGNPLEPVSL
jgi:hypothetical protein